MADTTEARDIIDITQAGAPPVALGLGQYWVVRSGDEIREIDLTGDRWRTTPRWIKGTTQVTDVASLHTYWDKHASTVSDMFADPTKHRFEAVLDAHDGYADDAGGDPNWQQHRAVCSLTLSDPMRAWQAYNGKEMSQETFGEFLDEQMPYITAPPGADLVEMVKMFEATTTAVFKSGITMQSGQRVLQYVEQVDASMGGSHKGGSIAIPKTIEIRTPVWRNMATTVDLTALLRFRVRSDKLALSYKLVGLTDILDGAFAAVVADVTEHIGRPVLLGTPLA